MTKSLTYPVDRLARVFDQAFGRDFVPTFFEDVSTHTWMPPVDIKETPEALIVNAELPGMEKDSIHISLENNVLTLSGERKYEREDKGSEWHRVERSYGSFSRSFSLPASVQADKVDASYKDGVLSVQIPKAETARPRKIAIR